MNYNPKPFENLLKRYLLRQAAEIDKLIDMYIRQLVLQSTRVNPPEDTEFEFRNYPSLSRAVDRTLRTMSNSITGTIQSGIEWAWDLANAKNDDMVARIVRSIGAGRIPQDALARWNQKNLPALEAFQQRKFSGMSLSDRVWDFSRGIKGDLELSIDLALGEGMSADKLAQKVKGYLKEPDRLYRRVRDEKGILRLSKAASNYHPGQGVYRSSYKNAKRLAGTETNIAYRSADHERVQQLDFILGIEVHLSKNHTCLNAKGEPEPFYDICDELQGRYPKDFKFVGWHPNCRCYTTTILPSEDEFFAYLDEMDDNGNSTYEFKNQVTEVPSRMTSWLEENEERIRRAKSLPYWIKDNPQIYGNRDSSKHGIEGFELGKFGRNAEKEAFEKYMLPENNAHVELSAEQKENARIIAESFGLKLNPMTFIEADEGRANMDYRANTMTGKNCQASVVIQEVRRRGVDLTALPFSNDEKTIINQLSKDTGLAWRTKDYSKHPQVPSKKGANQNEYEKWVEKETRPVGRYLIGFDFPDGKGGEDGHIVSAERLRDGSLLISETQFGGFSNLSDMMRIANSVEVLRIDRLLIDVDVLKAIARPL